MSSQIKICSCEGDLNNFGRGNCGVGIGIPKDAYFMIQNKVDGSVNGIDISSATLDQALIDSLFLAEEQRNRFFILPDIKLVEDEPVDDESEDVDGEPHITAPGIKEIKFVVVTSDPNKLKKALDGTLGCNSIGFGFIDQANALVGELNGNIFSGRKVIKNSFSAKVISRKIETIGKVEISFSLARESNDGKVDFIEAGEFVDPNTIANINPLIDVNISDLASQSTTALSFVLSTDSGSATNPIGAGGLTIADLEAYNVTNSVAVPLLTLVESSLGVYSGTTAAQVGAEVIRIQGKSAEDVQAPYDLIRIPATTVAVTP